MEGTLICGDWTGTSLQRQAIFSFGQVYPPCVTRRLGGDQEHAPGGTIAVDSQHVQLGNRFQSGHGFAPVLSTSSPRASCPNFLLRRAVANKCHAFIRYPVELRSKAPHLLSTGRFLSLLQKLHQCFSAPAVNKLGEIRPILLKEKRSR
jgi:hypothetical protein